MVMLVSYKMYMLGKVTALGVLCRSALFVCLILLASLFLPSHLSLKHEPGYVIVVCVQLYLDEV